ncbi:MAG TPA: hypothetical protein VKB72_10390 [Steroidobacteraceae bacterium]|nr:hypothetical protein [Steroidobacteraceae bacterium]
MGRVWALLTLMLTLGGCGLAGTGAAGASGAAAEAQQAALAKQTEDRVKQQIDSAEQQASDQRRAAEAAAQ